MIEVEYFREESNISDIRTFKNELEIWKWIHDMFELGEKISIISINGEEES